MKVLTLREWRLKRKLTQDELAAKAGVSQDTISDLETGRRPNTTVGTLGSLAEALGIQSSQIRFAETGVAKSHGRRSGVGVGL